jgi:type IV secretory pathway TrbL component
MARDVEYIFMRFLATWTPYLEKLLNSFAHFFIGSLILWEFSFLSSL